MNEIKNCRISEVEKNKLLIKRVNDRPNSMATYGQSKLNAEQTKDLFDKQFELSVERHNKLCDAVEDAVEKIEENATEGTTKDLKDLQDDLSNHKQSSLHITSEERETWNESAESIGDIETALDEIIELQEGLMIIPDGDEVSY